MTQDRREFLKKSLKVGALTGVAATPLVAKVTSDELSADGNGVVVGHSKKKEVLYHKSQAWEKFYKVAY